MKETIHPALHAVTVSCACGHTIQTVSTTSQNFNIDICGFCHPFFSGKKKFVDSAGKVEKFQKKYGALSVRKGKTTPSH